MGSSYTHTHFHTNTRRKGEKNRLGPGNFLIPISAPVWSVRAPALLGPVHMLLQTLRTDVLPWKYSALDFEVFQLSRVVLNLLEAVPESFGRLRNQNFLKLCDPFFFKYMTRLIPKDRCSKFGKWPVPY